MLTQQTLSGENTSQQAVYQVSDSTMSYIRYGNLALLLLMIAMPIYAGSRQKFTESKLDGGADEEANDRAG